MARLKLWAIWMALLTAMGAALKLSNPGSLSWWFVTAPLWGPPLFIGIGVAGCYAIIGLATLFCPEEK